MSDSTDELYREIQILQAALTGPRQREAFRAAVAALNARLVTDLPLPACWYAANTLLTADRLLKARKYLRHEKRGGRWFYHSADVRERWPDLWLHPTTLKPPTLPIASETGKKSFIVETDTRPMQQ